MLKATLQLKKTNKQTNKQTIIKGTEKFLKKSGKKLLRKGICLSKLSFLPPCFLKEIQYEQIPKDKRKYFFYVISCPATLLSIC